MIQSRDELTPREREQMQYDKDVIELQAEHTRAIKAMELETAKLEAKWSSWLRIPITFIKLPVFILFGVAYCIAVARKHEPSDNFWQFLK